jgi:3-dehydroquinate synthase
VVLPGRCYNIVIGPNLLSSVGEYFSHLFPAGAKVLIVTNATVDKLYGDKVRKELLDAGYLVSTELIGDGEEHKSLHTLSLLYDAAVRVGCHRDSVVVGLGGGIVGDVAGLLAATYMRGTFFVQIPTSPTNTRFCSALCVASA